MDVKCIRFLQTEVNVSACPFAPVVAFFLVESFLALSLAAQRLLLISFILLNIGHQSSSDAVDCVDFLQCISQVCVPILGSLCSYDYRVL
jgi:intracellular septation protein A